MATISEKISRSLVIKNIKKKGFTMIELIIVISIIGIITAIAVPKYSGVQKDAKRKADIASAKVIGDTTSTLIFNEGIDKSLYTNPKELGDAITDYIQVTPKVKVFTNGDFLVKIEADEEVQVFVHKKEDAAGLNYILYPTPDPLYGN